MITLFALHEAGVPIDHAVFEGDDALFSSPRIITDAIPTALGMRIKMEVRTSLDETSFCGNVFDDTDEIVMTDPKEALVDFGWTKRIDVEASSKRLDVLTRSKAYSLRYQYNGCPILTEFADYVLRVTKRAESGIDKFLDRDRTLSGWERDQIADAVKSVRSGSFKRLKPGFRSRVLCERLYHINTAEQVELEKYFRSLNRLEPVIHPVMSRWEVLHPEWKQYFEEYNSELLINNRMRVPLNKAPEDFVINLAQLHLNPDAEADC